jgi:hypothetical protein
MHRRSKYGEEKAIYKAGATIYTDFIDRLPEALGAPFAGANRPP